MVDSLVSVANPESEVEKNDEKKEKEGKEKVSLVVPILPLESILNEKNQKEDEPVINIVTGGSFGRINQHQQNQASNS